MRFIPLNLVSESNRQIAYKFCSDIDENDTPFIALSLELNAPLWTGDLKLKKGLIEKGFKNFISVE